MLAIQKPATRQPTPCTPHLLPCRIHHNGPVNAATRYWNPEPSATPTSTIAVHANANGNGSDNKNDNEDSNDTGNENEDSNEATQTAYFRGRKLQGRHVPLPSGYRGVVLSNTERTLLHSLAAEWKRPMNWGVQEMAEQQQDDEDEGQEGEEEVKVMEEIGEFDGVVVWRHEAGPHELEDEVVRGVGEWVGFAEMMHLVPDKGETGEGKS